MYYFSQYTFEEQTFNLSQGTSKTTRVGARVEAGAQAPKIVSRILYKSFLEYLKTLVAMIATGGFVFEALAG